MLVVRIETSRRGRLWATEYWKPLIDGIARGGAKHDPRQKYADLEPSLRELIEERNGRFYPKSETPLSRRDDTAIRIMIVRRVEPGEEGVWVGDAELPPTNDWRPVEFPYFGTIGDSKYEAQTLRNRETLSNVFVPPESPARLELAFQLSTNRRDRDLDNLADALMPFFNKEVRRFDEIVLAKLAPQPTDVETLRFSCAGLSGNWRRPRALFD